MDLNFFNIFLLFFFCRRSTSLPLPPPPPTLTDEGNFIQNTGENEEKSTPNYFFAPLKSKRKSSICSEQRPDIFVNNIVPSDGNRLATIRKPYNPLKYPSNLNAASVDQAVISNERNFFENVYRFKNNID